MQRGASGWRGSKAPQGMESRESANRMASFEMNGCLLTLLLPKVPKVAVRYLLSATYYAATLTYNLHNLRPRWSAFLSFEDTGARHRLGLY